MVVFTDIRVFCFSILVSVDPQKCSLVWYTLKYWVAWNLILHSQHLNFIPVSLFLVENTWHPILLHCISQCLLCLVSSLLSKIVDGACLPSLVVKTLSVEVSLLVCGGSSNCNILGPPVNPWTTGTVGWQFVFLDHYVKLAPVTPSVWLSVSLSLWAEMY